MQTFWSAQILSFKPNRQWRWPPCWRWRWRWTLSNLLRGCDKHLSVRLELEIPRSLRLMSSYSWDNLWIVDLFIVVPVRRKWVRSIIWMFITFCPLALFCVQSSARPKISRWTFSRHRSLPRVPQGWYRRNVQVVYRAGTDVPACGPSVRRDETPENVGACLWAYASCGVSRCLDEITISLFVTM